MALINCPECGKQVSDTASLCPHCGCNVQKGIKKQAKELSNKQAIEDWNNAPQAQKNVSIIIFIAICIFVLIILIKAFSNDTDHTDGKCDICNKDKYSSLQGEEYCYAHYKDALDYYLED